MVATLAPSIGPTVGGCITDAMSWHWLFLVNVVPGIMVTVATWTLIDFDKPNLGLFSKFDWWGLAGMAAFSAVWNICSRKVLTMTGCRNRPCSSAPS